MDVPQNRFFIHGQFFLSGIGGEFMKVLLTVEYYLPSVGGAQEVVRQIAEHLVRSGHDVTVATTMLPERKEKIVNGVKIIEFMISGNQVRGYTGNIEEYQQFLLAGQFDLMMNYAAQQWSADLVFPILGSLPFPAILAPCGFSGLQRLAYQNYFSEMPDVLRKYNHLVFHSEKYQDIEFTRAHGILHFSVIPNAAGDEFEMFDPTFRQTYGIPEGEALLLTVGNHTGLKGHRLVIRAFQKARIGKSTLIIIGDLAAGRCVRECRALSAVTKLLSLGKKRILLIHPPRPVVVAAYHAADLFVFGSRVEASPLVLFEAMASRTPFLTTACGNAEEIISWGNSGRLVPTFRLSNGWVDAKVDDFANAIEVLWREPEERKRMAQNGYEVWKERFTWEKVTAEYEKLFRCVAERGRE
jgi:glycosyltransferase involved in cell wall biosynthesis